MPKELSASESNKKAKELIKERKLLKLSDMVPGRLIFTSYDAIDKKNTYDPTPLILVLRRNRKYTLGLNFHWIPLSMRINLIKTILKMNRENIKKGKPIDFNYIDLKPMLKALGYAPCIRLYVNSRMGRKGVVIPPERLVEVARLKTESFTNGRYSAAQMYAMARAAGKRRKK